MVADARSSLQVFADAIWAAKSPREVLAAMEELERLRSSVRALESIVAVELDQTGAPESELDWESTRDYLTFTMGGERQWRSAAAPQQLPALGPDRHVERAVRR